MSFKSMIKHGVMTLSSMFHNDHGSKILYYHDIFKTINYPALDADIKMGTPLEMFKRHVAVIREEGYEILPHITKPKGQVAIMLDDGFRGIYECRDYFYGQKIYPTIFLPVKFIGRSDLGIMTKEEILDLQKHGFCFQSHGWTHSPLTEVAESELQHELADSKQYLEDMLCKKIDSICLPLGYFTEDILKEIRSAGYTNIYSSIPGSGDFKPHGMMPRNLCQYATANEVRLILRGGNEMLNSRIESFHNHTAK